VIFELVLQLLRHLYSPSDDYLYCALFIVFVMLVSCGGVHIQRPGVILSMVAIASAAALMWASKPGRICLGLVLDY
jgi:hypothetical protein